MEASLSFQSLSYCSSPPLTHPPAPLPFPSPFHHPQSLSTFLSIQQALPRKHAHSRWSFFCSNSQLAAEEELATLMEVLGSRKAVASLQTGADVAGVAVQHCILLAGGYTGFQAAHRIGMPCVAVRSSADPRVKPKNHFHVRCSKGLSGDAEGRSGNENLTQVDEQSLEAELQVAIHSENYVKAARLRDELRALQEDNRAGVVAANAKFYKAFESGDLRLMRTIWAQGDNVHCIHPGAGCISGYDLVMASWELMLGPELALPLRIDLQNMEVHVKGNLAFVTCLEVVRTSGSSWGKQVATNIFEKQNGSWYICVHHASHITT